MKLVKFALMACFLLPLSAAAEAASGSDAKDAFDMWLVAHNSGERSQFEAYNTRYNVTQDVEDDLDIRDSVGSLQVAEVRRSSPTDVQVLLVSEWGRAILATFERVPGVPLKVKRQLEGAPMPEAFKPRPMALDALAEEAKRRLDALESEDKVSGSFLLARNGQPLFEWHGGLADREASVAVSPTTRFRFASLGKMFTAVAILQLVDAGKVSLDKPLSTYLPDYPNRAVADAVTVRQLLNHTGGTGEVFGDAFNRISNTLRTHHDYWAAFAARPLEFEPGSRDGYSNYGYILLGSVIEAISGTSYYDYVEQHVYRPAGMSSTGAEPEAEAVPRRAHAYTRTDGRWTRETESLPWRGTAAGGGYTTAGDLMRFAAALNNGTLLSATSLDAATRAQNHKAWYGYGFMVSGEGGQRQFGHEGGAPGSNAVLNVKPAAGYVVIGLSNVDPAAMENTVNYVTQRLP